MSDYIKDTTDGRIANDSYLNAYKPQLMAGYDPINKEVLELNVDSKGKTRASGDDVGREPFNTIFGDRIIAQKIDQVLVKFDLGINTMLTIQTVANGGTVTESNSRLLLSSSTATNGQTQLASRDVIRYRPGHEIFAYFTCGWLNAGIAGSVQNIGIFDAENGYFVGFNGTNFRVSRRYNSIDNDVNQSDFNLDTIDGLGPSKFNLDYTKVNIFRITFGYLGIAPAIFEVYAGTGTGWIAFHSIDLINISSELSLQSPNLCIAGEIIKTSGSTDIQMVSGSWNGGYYDGGSGNVGSVPFQYDTDMGRTLTGTGNENVVIFRLKTTFNGKVNKTRVQNTAGQFENTTSDIILAHITANPTTIGGVAVGSLTYTDVNTASTVEFSEGGTGGNATGVVIGGRRLLTVYMVGGGQGSGAFSGGGSFNAAELGLVGAPGETFCVSFERVSGSGGYIALNSMNWLELF